jgi:RES domain-containing protein
MIPDARFIKDGRANPPGFAYLYLASTPETALAEMRPVFRESVTLAKFNLKKTVNLISCWRFYGHDNSPWK